MKKTSIIIFAIVLAMLSSCKLNLPKNETIVSNLEKAQQWVDDFSREDFEKITNSFSYSSEVKDVINETVIENFYDQLINRHGKIINSAIDNEQSLNEFEIKSFILECEKSEFTLSLTFDEGKICGINFYPIIDDTFMEKGEHIKIGTKNMELPGVLLRPNNQTKYLVIILPDSGPQDLNGTLGVNKPYKDIAEQLFENGIASFRFHKRSYYYMDKIDFEKITANEDIIEDAISAITYFYDSEIYHFEKIFLLGHGAGGYFLPQIFQQAKQTTGLSIDGLIYLAANAPRFEDLIVTQAELQFNNVPQYISEDEVTEIKNVRDIIKNLTLESNYASSQLFGLSVPYYINLKEYEPTDIVQTIDCPMLFLFAENDKIVPYSEFEIWNKELKQKEGVTFKMYKGLNHAFMQGTGWQEQDFLINSNISHIVINDITNWINTNTIIK